MCCGSGLFDAAVIGLPADTLPNSGGKESIMEKMRHPHFNRAMM